MRVMTWNIWDSGGKRIPLIAEVGDPEWMKWNTFHYSIKTHPREIVENLADRAHFPVTHRTELAEFSFEVDRHMATQKVKGTARLPGGGVDRFGSTTTYHGPGYLIMRMSGVTQNWMLVAHTPVDAQNVEMRMGVMLKNIPGQDMEKLSTLYTANLKSGFEDDFRVWENKVYREAPVLCDGDGPIMQLRRWYRQFYVAPETAQAQPEASAS